MNVFLEGDNDMAASATPNSDITANARAALSGRWMQGIGAFILYGFFATGLQLADSALEVVGVPTFGLIYGVFSGPLWVGIAGYFLLLSRGTSSVSDLFCGCDRFGRSVLTYFLYALFITLWSLLFVIPGVIKSFSYAMTPYILADDPDVSAVAAITRSRELMDGNKMKFWLLQWRFLGWGILAVFTFGIGFLWLIPYVQASHAAFYEDLKAQSDGAVDVSSV
jgi:uncharacterized membrane protein